MSKRFARGKQLLGRKKTPSPGSEQKHQQQNEITKAGATGGTHGTDRPIRAADEQWVADMAILRRAAEELTHRRISARVPAPWLPADGSSSRFADALARSSQDDWNQTVRAFYQDNPDRAVSLFAVALREGSPEQRRRIGAALVGSGLVSDAIEVLTRERSERSYSAFSLLVLAAKTGQIGPLVSAIENHSNLELRLKLIRLMVSSGEREILEAFRRLAVSQSLPGELRSVIVEAINQLNSQTRETAA